MTKQEILNGMSEQEFYSMYPTKEAWEQSQQEMAYGGSPFIQGFPFGAGITMADGGTPYYGGPIRPYAYGGGINYFDEGGPNRRDYKTAPTLTPEQMAFSKANLYPAFNDIYNKMLNNRATDQIDETGNAGADTDLQDQLRIANTASSGKPLDPGTYARNLNNVFGENVIAFPTQPGSIVENWDNGQYSSEPQLSVDEVNKKISNSIMKKRYLKNFNVLNPEKDFEAEKIDQYYNNQEIAYGGIPKAVYGKTIPPTGVPELGSNIKGATSNVDLTASVKWNQDPTQISKDVNTGGYNAFQSWLQKQQYEGQPFINNPSLNTPEGKKKMTEWALNEFNTKSDYIQKFPQNKITPESVKAIQEYHKKSDPSVQVDSWVGSQTSRMRYPTPNAMYEQSADNKTPLSTEGYVPVTYGDKQYVVDASKYAGGKQPVYSDFVPYDAAQHHEKLQKPKSSPQYEKYYKTFQPSTQQVASSKYGGAPCYNCGGSPMEYGGAMTQDLQGQYPIFGQGGYDYGGPSPFNYGQFPAMRHGGDTTKQGGNQAFLKDRKDSYMSFIQNNVVRDLHQKTSKEVGNAFMEMEQGQHQMPDGSMMDNSMMAQYGNQINPQNAALQNMYRQGMDQYNTQKRQDYSNFGAMTEDFLGQISGQYAKGGKAGKIHTPNWEYSNYVPTNDIRTGYVLGKSDFANFAKLQGQGKVTGAKFNYNALGILAPRMFGPKSIELGITGPAFGRYEDQMQVKPSFSIPGQKGKKKSQGPYPETDNAPEVDDRLSDMQHGELVPKIYPFDKSIPGMMSSNLNKQPPPTKTIGPVDNRSTAWEQRMNSKNNAMLPYSEQFNKAYGGLVYAQNGLIKESPIDMQPDYLEQKNSLDLFSKYVDDDSKNRIQATEDAGLKNPETNSLYGSGNITLKKKTTGIGKFLGKNSALIADTASSMLENKENLNSQEELNNSMLADNTMTTTPLNAKNKGGYDPNSGVYQPDQYVTKYGGVNWGTPNVFQTGGDFEEGEELDLSPEELEYYERQGYKFEYLD